ncbi:hypothetical protein CFN78_06810 [Amycolatopsis antarctica]|uniref:Uncharacterized protein n=1 Tax=Amycolatopsis antarctica TaxID=1854586 RepID=A0A263D6E9_9PSEU|nr:hypothetical protein [Amycolatopsis antarctica]OZM73993.1 hypothetical protein CFN78_06810 [Amycolatopsis antarctica]
MATPTDIPIRRNRRPQLIAGAVLVAGIAAGATYALTGNSDADPIERGTFEGRGTITIADTTAVGYRNPADAMAASAPCEGSGDHSYLYPGPGMTAAAPDEMLDTGVPMLVGFGEVKAGTSTAGQCVFPFTVDVGDQWGRYTITVGAHDLGTVTEQQLRDGTATLTVD